MLPRRKPSSCIRKLPIICTASQFLTQLYVVTYITLVDGSMSRIEVGVFDRDLDLCPRALNGRQRAGSCFLGQSLICGCNDVSIIVNVT